MDIPFRISLGLLWKSLLEFLGNFTRSLIGNSSRSYSQISPGDSLPTPLEVPFGIPLRIPVGVALRLPVRVDSDILPGDLRQFFQEIFFFRKILQKLLWVFFGILSRKFIGIPPGVISGITAAVTSRRNLLQFLLEFF